MSKTWINYKEIKEKVSLEAVLAQYGLLDSLRPSGPNLVGYCPIHKGSNSRQFSVNLERGIYNCFGDCQGGGNVIDFVARMENVPASKAALLLKDWFLSESKTKDRKPVRKAPVKGKAKKPGLVREKKEGEGDADTVNAPLAFKLKTVTREHPFFTEKGIEPETVEYFDLGYCERGMMKGRIAIPVHDEKGELVAYCGRAVTDDQAKQEGKYKLPPNFNKSAVVYNLNRQQGQPDCLILVESYLSVFRLHQSGFPNVAALMGSSLSERQAELISGLLGPHGHIVLLFDADESGRKCTDDCLSRLKNRLFVKSIDVSPYGKKPHHLNPEQLRGLLA